MHLSIAVIVTLLGLQAFIQDLIIVVRSRCSFTIFFTHTLARLRLALWQGYHGIVQVLHR